MNALIAKERYHFHERLFETNTLTLTKAGVASNADTSSRGSKAIAKKVVDILVEEQQHKINMVEKISTTTFQEPIYSQNIQQFLYNHLSLKETIGCAASEHTSAFCSLLLPLRAIKPLYSVLMSDPIDY